MEQGKTEEAILRQCVQQRLPVPDAIANAPELVQGSEFFLQAYLELSSCKVQDGPIPWTAMVQYIEVHEVDGELLDELMFIVRYLDNEMGAYRNQKADAKAKAAAKGRTRNGK